MRTAGFTETVPSRGKRANNQGRQPQWEGYFNGELGYEVTLNVTQSGKKAKHNMTSAKSAGNPKGER